MPVEQPDSKQKTTFGQGLRVHLRSGFNFIWLVALFIILYFLWEFYWAKKVGYHFIKWHTHLAVYLCLWLLIVLVLSAVQRIYPLKDYLKYQTICFSVCAALFLSEALLMILGIHATYTEKIGYGYSSMWSERGETYYRTRIPNDDFFFDRPEFKHHRHTNSLGYSDMEWPIAKKKREKRILCLGDSFTEGIGVASDSTYARILATILDQNDSIYTVMNGGTSGDDPCVNYVNYRDRLSAFKPDVILQTLSSNDLNTDMATKGGLERFQNDGIKFPEEPWWEPIYAVSYVSRLLFHAIGYNDLLLKVPFSKEKTDELNRKACELFTLYADRAQKQGCLLIVVLQPDHSSIWRRGYEYDLSAIVKHLQALQGMKVYDLLPFYLAEFDQSKDNGKNYYWAQDGHHNAKGYALMAKGMKMALDSFYINTHMTDQKDTIN